MKEDSSVEVRTYPAEKAWAMLLEEFEKGLPGSVPDLSVTHIREVHEGFGGHAGSGEDQGSHRGRNCKSWELCGKLARREGSRRSRYVKRNPLIFSFFDHYFLQKPCSHKTGGDARTTHSSAKSLEAKIYCGIFVRGKICI